MKKVFSLCLICLLAVSAMAQRAAVMEFKAGVDITQADVDGLSGIFTTYFHPAGYTMIERTQIDRIIEEQRLQRSTLTESQMVRVGQLLNLSKIVIGDVNVVMGQYNVDVRVINVESGTIAATEGATFAGSSYRETMKSLAQKLAGQIAIGAGPTVSAQPTPSTPAPKKRTSVETVYGYLHVFPNELGVFQSIPTNVISNINNQGMHGYNIWRIPTTEELTLLKANGYLREEKYMSKEEPIGCVLLVATGKSIVEFNKTSENGYEWVDLGLSVKWATKNLRFYSENKDDYYGWGEITSNTAATWCDYKWASAKYDRYETTSGRWEIHTTCEFRALEKYDSTDNKTVLEYEDDPARIKMGGTWRIPTSTEYLELKENCYWKWTTDYNGTKTEGYVVTSKINGASIFLPVTGYYFSCNDEYDRYFYYDSKTCFESGVGAYWSSSLNTKNNRTSFALEFGYSNITIVAFDRPCSLAIRAVCE